jgi:hypothetical protein
LRKERRTGRRQFEGAWREHATSTTARPLARGVGTGYDRETSYLRTDLGTLRTKLEADPGRPEHLIIEPGTGYRFVVVDTT